MLRGGPELERIQEGSFREEENCDYDETPTQTDDDKSSRSISSRSACNQSPDPVSAIKSPTVDEHELGTSSDEATSSGTHFLKENCSELVFLVDCFCLFRISPFYLVS